MVSKSQAHAARQSPVPGVVVVVLAVAAILFGVAFVRRSETRNADLNREFARVRAELEAAQTAQSKLARRLNERLREFDEGGFAEADGLADLEFQVEVTADGEVEPQCENTAPPAAAEVLVVTTASGPSTEPAPAAPAREVAVAQAPPAVTEVPRAPQPTPRASQQAAPAPAEPRPAAPPVAGTEPSAGPSAEPSAGPGSSPALEAARAVATEHEELLAPFFAAGREQPDGSRTSVPGPMSWRALQAAGALVPPTEDALEANPGLRKLADIASNAPNDRPLWPYTRGSRARVWYLRGDGRARVPLAQALLREHGEAFVALGLLAP